MLALYTPLIERDLAAIPAALRAHRAEHGSEETFKAVGRFAVLGYSPSQHGKHALLACLAAWELRETLGERFDDLVTQLAIYAAEARQPWSEPPILTPPPVEEGQRGDLEELREAIAEGDRLRGERWLAKRIDDPDLVRDYFAAAADDFEDLGHKLIVADAVWRLVPVLGEQGRFAALRVGIWEMTAYRGERFVARGEAVDREALLERLVEGFVASDGDLEAAHALFLLDAAWGKDVEGRVREYLSGGQALLPVPPPEDRQECLSYTYRLARDYAQFLKIAALAHRRNLPQLLGPAKRNLDRSHFDELSFA